VSIYGTSTIKRKRRTKAEIEALDAMLWEIVDQYRFARSARSFIRR